MNKFWIYNLQYSSPSITKESFLKNWIWIPIFLVTYNKLEIVCKRKKTRSMEKVVSRENSKTHMIPTRLCPKDICYMLLVVSRVREEFPETKMLNLIFLSETDISHIDSASSQHKTGWRLGWAEYQPTWKIGTIE